MRLKNLDLMVTMVLVAVSMVWVLLPYHIPIVGVILALPLVFLLPGYVLTDVLSQKRVLDASHRLTLSLGLSLAIDILSGFVLNVFPVGLQATSWVAFLGLFTVVFALLAAYVRRGAPINTVRSQWPRFSISACVLLGAAVIVTVFSVTYSAVGVAQQPHPGFTQLWMLPPVHSAKGCAVRLGIRSFERTTTTYRITMTLNGVRGAAWQSVVLAPQQEWGQQVFIPLGATHQGYVEAKLYQVGKPETAYQRVNLLLHRDGQAQQCKT